MDTPAETPFQTRDLQQCLSHVTSDQVSLSRQLFASPRVLQSYVSSDAELFRIFGATLFDGAEAVELRGHQHAMHLLVTKPRSCDQLRDRAWSDFQGESRLLAWCLSHERLLERLQAIFQQPLLPRRMCNRLSTNLNTPDVVMVGFAMGADSAAPSFEGAMRLPLPWAKRLLISSSVEAAELSCHDLGHLPVVMSLQIPGPRLGLPRLRDISPGDTIVVGSSTAAFNRVELRNSNKTWFWAGIRNAELRITSPRFRDVQTQPEECKVNVDKIDVNDTNMEDESVSVPIALQFEIGALTLTFDEVSRLQPGYTFALPEPVAGTNVRIRANGTLVGRGELMVVGETLGVCVTRWSDDGLQ